MAAMPVTFQPLPTASFGVLAKVEAASAGEAVDAFLAARDAVCTALDRAGGLMVVRGLAGLREAPADLVRISEIFGPEVENYRGTLTAARFFHDEVPEVLVLSNMAPCNHPPPPRPDPPLTAQGQFPVQFPQRGNWHTDQSYRRPPPDITLLLGVITPPQGQGQTLFADCTAASGGVGA